PAATTAPAAAPKPAESKPVAAPAARPEQKLGEQLIGKLEGPEVITDPAQYPTSFKEAPQLAELVKAGQLPPVNERIGQDPLVVKPVHEIGKYGGQWRMGFTGVADYWLGLRSGSGTDYLLYRDYTAQKVVPNIARAWEVTDDGRTITLSLRRGMRWSDGAPFTADDFMFWWEDLYQNKELVPNPTHLLSINGKPGTMEKVDAQTIRFRFPDPYYLFVEVLSLGTSITSHANFGEIAMGGFAPAHYLKQFHPKHTPQAELDAKVRDAGFPNWVDLFKFKNNWWLNPELPAVTPWVTKTPANTPNWTLERNPYSIWVDTGGNQLPYIDKLSLTLGENLEVINLRAIAGEFDMQARHIQPAKLPVLLENQEKGGYTVSINPMGNGSDYGFYLNLDYPLDDEIRKWFNNRDFRRALSLGIDREQLNEAFLLGTGVAGSPAPVETNKYSPGPEYRTLWHTYDPDRANQMLDQIGLDKKDGEGFRLRTDGKGPLRLEIVSPSASFLPFGEMGEMIRAQWRRIGVHLDVKDIERGLVQRRGSGNENQIVGTWNSDTEALFLGPWYGTVPIDTLDWAMPRYGQWFATDGKEGQEPPEAMRRAMEMYKKAFGVPEEESIKLGQEIWKLVVEEVWYIGVLGQSPAIMGVQVTKKNMGNVPGRITNFNFARPPSVARPMTFYWKS
ncbi:MAG: ABC transporter substrate-binding protein, partial [Chloroflexota bacterium]|nr:ABC transporter substrate-binding protein [Chloroflexota bacterium]